MSPKHLGNANLVEFCVSEFLFYSKVGDTRKISERDGDATEILDKSRQRADNYEKRAQMLNCDGSCDEFSVFSGNPRFTVKRESDIAGMTWYEIVW